MKFALETITPETAKMMLGNNPQNRNIKRAHVDLIARDMVSNRWQVNGDAIRLSADGALIDGQHRLAACVKAGVPFQTLVIRDLPAEARDTIDAGAKRSVADRLHMNGVNNGALLASITRLVVNYARGSARQVSYGEVAEMLKMYPRLSVAATRASGVAHRVGTPLGAAYFFTDQFHGEMLAERLRTVWKTGIPDHPGDAMHYLRERIAKAAISRQPLGNAEVCKLMSAAWKNWIKKKGVKSMPIPEKLDWQKWSEDDLPF